MATLSVSHPPQHDARPAPVGADIVLRVLEARGVDVVFGMPGGAVLPLYDALARGTTLRHVLVRHEQGAGHMAQGYARASGRPGVVFATSGPGATNLVTPIADARMDSTPLVCVTGQVRSAVIGTMAFQECDIVSVVEPLVKRAWQVRDVADLAEVLDAAITLACEGRPGPVLVDIPRDVQEAVCALPARSAATPSVAAVGPDDGTLAAAAVGLDSGALAAAAVGLDGGALAAAAAAIDGAARPVLYAGGGAQGAAPPLLALAEAAGLPVVTTLLGKGAFPESHELFVGWPGMHGTRTANLALHEADLIIAAGARFDDRVTGRVDVFAPQAQVVHIDVDPREHGKIRHAEIPIAGPLDAVLRALAGMVARRPAPDAWRQQLDAWQQRFPLAYAPAEDALRPQMVLQHLDEMTRECDDVVWTTGVGQHQMWAMQYLTVDRPRSFVTSGGHGTMGFGLPAAIGAQLARPDATVVCVDGDGSFQMTLQELATAAALALPVIVVIVNNGNLGMVRQWQSMFYDGRLCDVDLADGMPDFAAVARGFGAVGVQVSDLRSLDQAFTRALTAGRPTVIDVLVEPAEDCYPMIVPGGAAAEQVEFAGGRGE
jgi:acetolactate synthase-1/2/3 large subunit